MNKKVALLFVIAAALLPLVTSLFDLEARRRGGGGVIIITDFNDNPKTKISPN